MGAHNQTRRRHLQRGARDRRQQSHGQLLNNDETEPQYPPATADVWQEDQDLPRRNTETLYQLFRRTQKTTLPTQRQGTMDQLCRQVHR